MAICAVVVALAMPTRADKKRVCKANREVIGECFRLHGRLAGYNGNPTYRIWRIGTKRLLGVHDDEKVGPLMPEWLQRKVDFERFWVYGDFEVCPLTKEEPEEMQIVCVESASNIVMRERIPQTSKINQ
jgi:hypothetical protein